MDATKIVLMKLTVYHIISPGEGATVDQIAKSYSDEITHLAVGGGLPMEMLVNGVSRGLTIPETIDAVSDLFGRGLLEREKRDDGDKFKISQKGRDNLEAKRRD